MINRYDTSKINNFYAILRNSKGKDVYIEYDEFLSKIDLEKREKYDGKHFIVRLSTADIEKIILWYIMDCLKHLDYIVFYCKLKWKGR